MVVRFLQGREEGRGQKPTRKKRWIITMKCLKTAVLGKFCEQSQLSYIMSRVPSKGKWDALVQK